MRPLVYGDLVSLFDGRQAQDRPVLYAAAVPLHLFRRVAKFQQGFDACRFVAAFRFLRKSPVKTNLRRDISNIR